MRMQGWYILPRHRLLHGKHVTIMRLTDCRGALVERCDKSVVFHPRVLDGVECRLILNVVQLGTDKPHRLFRANAHALAHVTRQASR